MTNGQFLALKMCCVHEGKPKGSWIWNKCAKKLKCLKIGKT